MANNNIDVAVFQVPDGTITLPTWKYIMDQISGMMNTLITQEDSINEDLKTMDAKLAEWAGDETTVSYDSFDPIGSTEPVFDQLSALMVEQASVIASMSDHLNAIELEGGGVGETIEPGTQYVVDDVTYTTYTGAEIFNAYTAGSGRNGAAGSYSHAEGQYNNAYGSYSHTEGQSNITTESCAHAEGSYNKSTGYSSHTEGQNNQASGYAAHAEGGFTKALENYAHTEGQSTQVKSGAYNGHAEGYSTVVEKPCGHTEGRNTKVITNGECAHAEGDGTTASGNAAHSEGYMTTASGIYAHAEGGSCTASGAQSHAEGRSTTSSGTQSHAEGDGTTASGNQSHAEGDRTTASAPGSHAEGSQNTTAANYSHVEGGNNTVNPPALYSHAEGSNHTMNAIYGHAEGLHNTLNSTADCGHVEGRDNVLTGVYGHIEGSSNEAKSGATNAHIEGYGNTIETNAYYAHAEGYNTIVSGGISHAEGNCTQATGSCSHAQNDHTIASGGGSTAIGGNTTASGTDSLASGWHTEAQGNSSVSMGSYTIAAATNQVVIGEYNISESNPNYLFIIGNGDANARSNAFKIDNTGKIYVGNNNGVDVSGLYVTSNDDAKVLTASYQNGVGTYSWAPASGGGECIIVTDTSTSLPNKVVIENNHEYRYLNLANATSITISIENVDITKSFYSTVVLHDVTSTDILSNFVSVSQDSVLSNVIFLNEDFVDLSDSNTVEMLFFTNGMANTVMCIAYGYTSASPEPPAPIPDPDINEDKYNVYNLTTGETTIYDDQASAAAYLNANTDTNFDVYMGANVATPVTTRYDTGVYITTDWQNVSNLRKFTCNNKVVEVPEGAFRNSSLTEFIRGNGAGANDSYYVWFLNGCFYGCVNMKSFDVLPPEGVTPPGACQFTTWGNEGVFEGTGLETFVGDEVIDVMGIAASAWGENMFKDCTSLTTVTLKSEGGQDEELPTKMFSGCTALTTINVMDPELVRWASDALEGCSDVTINRHDYVDTSRRTTWDEADKPWGANSVTINTIYDLE